MSSISVPQYEANKMIDKYQNTVYRLAISLTKSKTDADDIFQEVFLKYITNAPVFNDSRHEEGWFVQTTVNCCNTFFRKAKAALRRTVPLDEIETRCDDKNVRDNDNRELLEAVLKLSPKLSAAVHLYYYQGYSAGEIAKILNISETAVQTRLYDGRKKLAQFIKE